jgi:hypothetical protein
MDRRQSGGSHSTLDDLPTEKNDPLFDHLRNVDAMGRTTGDLEPLHQTNTGRSNSESYDNGEQYGNEEEYDLEAQSAPPSTMGKSLTRADTAAWVTKHPSRIPDDGTLPLCFVANEGSDEKERIDVYCGV